MIAFNSFAQKTFTIVDGSTFQPIPSVEVYNNSFSTTSDSSGTISLNKDISENDSLYFNHLSYLSHVIKFSQIQKGKVYLFRKTLVLNEFVFSLGKIQEEESKIPHQISVLNSKILQLQNPATSADLLKNSNGVFIQKSQFGGGSPIIRGFEANKILIVVDGVRMNNAIYRSGHLQNVITIDPNIQDRVEVVFGPGSVIYGSDALGGVMHFYTKKPLFSINDGLQFRTNFTFRGATATGERTAHLDMNWGRPKWSILTSLTYSGFSDLRSGKKKNKDYPEFGDNRFYVKTIEQDSVFSDSMITNINPHIQKNTGYRQYDVVNKFRWKPKDDVELNLNFQFSTSSKINRYDQLNEYTTRTIDLPDTIIEQEILKFAEWYYGPQTRWFNSAQVTLTKPNLIFNEATFTAAFQKINEDRVSRKFGQDRRNINKEDVLVFSANADFVKHLKSNKVLFGGEFTSNIVNSSAYSQNINTLDSIPNATRYPDGGSTMNTSAFYVSSRWSIKEKTNIHAGIRNTSSVLISNFIDTSLYKLPFDKIKILSNNVAGSIGINHNVNKKLKLNLVLSNGFKTPNVDDVGKIRSKNGIVTVPNDGLKAEKSYSTELGFRKQFGEFLEINATGYFSYLTDAVVQESFSLDGTDTLYYDGAFEDIQANVNTGSAYITGYSISAKANFLKHFSLSATNNFTKGIDRKNFSPLAHIPPMYGRITFNYNQNKINTSLYVDYNGWKRLEDYSDDSSDNLEYATADGTYAWATLNLKFNYQLSKRMSFQFGVENILNQHYRPFSSGVSAPGRNFILSLRGSF